MENSGASNSILKYANVNTAYDIEAIGTSNISIQHCNITDTYAGIDFSSASGNMQYNVISNASIGHGIIVENSSTAKCFYNTVTKNRGDNDRRGVGILYRGGSNGYMYQNDVKGWDWGIGAIYSSSPQFRLYPDCDINTNNRTWHCNNGIMIYNNSWPVIGNASPCTWNNSIYQNSKNVNFTSGGQLSATNVYWGGTPVSSMFYLGSGCTINTTPYLGYNPWDYMQMTASNGGQSTVNNQSSKPDPESFFDGITLRNENKYKEAKDYFISYLSKHPDKQAAYVELYNCYNDETAQDLIKYFASLPKEAAKEQKLLLSYLYIKQGNAARAKKNNDAIINENINDDLTTEAKINNLYIALYNEDNFEEANKIYNEISVKSGIYTAFDGTQASLDISLVYNAMLSYAQEHGIEFGIKGSSTIQKKITTTTKAETPKEYNLLGNYPNPFNPTTTISYNLPRMSDVELKIYDILGNEVKSFFVPSQSVGTQNIVWNGSNNYNEQVSSGIYIYRFKAVSREGKSEVFEKSAKLIMLK